MKRIIALAWLAALFLCVGAARAAEWREGLGPGQPYTNVPEIDLTERLGYMMFYPNEDMAVENVCRTLYVYLPREDVKRGEGLLRLNTEKDGAVMSIAMSDENLVRQRAMTEEELDWWLWGGGTCFEIQLPRSLDFGKTYYVTMAKGCIVTEDGVENPPISDRGAWRVALAGEYGIGGMTCRRPQTNEESILTPRAGDEIAFDVVLGGEAASAALYSRDASVDFTVSYLETSSRVTGTCTSDSPAWGIMFFDAEGRRIHQMELGEAVEGGF